MTNEEQILAGIEEIANQLNSIRRSFEKEIKPEGIDPDIKSKIDRMAETIYSMNIKGDTSGEELKRIFSAIGSLNKVIQAEKPSVEHKYIQIRNPISWLIGMGIYFMITFSACLIVTLNNYQLRETIKFTEPSDYKYRYLKLKAYSFKNFHKDIKNTNDLLYAIDDYYIENQEEVKEFVLRREYEIRQAFEAAEIAKQKEAEAKAAREEAEKLKSGIK
jgi:hypothetical protein